jgi:hypothetical protein
MEFLETLKTDDSDRSFEKIIFYLRNRFEGYPFCYSKDPMYFMQLSEDFKDLELLEELKQYHAWVLDQPEDKKIFYRSRFRSWLKTAQGFKGRPHCSSHWRR